MTTKIAVSLPDDLVAAAHAAVASGRSPSVSGYVAEALDLRRRHDSLAELLAEMTAEDGRPNAEDLARARRELEVA
ncbi:MAG: hypothetical protein FWF28_06445 [Micrococcales bacterium]|nr:hypothetical protein [Micrococcales bacterium]